jgi:hypothetical protein
MASAQTAGAHESQNQKNSARMGGERPQAIHRTLCLIHTPEEALVVLLLITPLFIQHFMDHLRYTRVFTVLLILQSMAIPLQFRLQCSLQCSLECSLNITTSVILQVTMGIHISLRDSTTKWVQRQITLVVVTMASPTHLTMREARKPLFLGFRRIRSGTQPSPITPRLWSWTRSWIVRMESHFVEEVNEQVLVSE